MAATATTHVAVCPFPFTSHPGSALLLAGKMAAAAADVHFSFFITERAAKAVSVATGTSAGNIRFRRLDDGDAEGKAGSLAEQVEIFMKGAGKSFRDAMDVAEREVGLKISCVVSDAFLASVVGEIADERAAKWVALWSPGATSLAAHMYTDALRSAVGEDGIEVGAETVDHYIPCFPAIRLSEIPGEVTRADLSSGIGKTLYTMALKLPKVDAVVINSCHALENSVIAALNQEKFNNKLLCLGPFSFTIVSSSTKVDDDSHGCLPWLDTQLSVSGPSTVAYISFGTATSPPSEELATLARALECIDVPFLWALPHAHHASLPEGFCDRVMVSGKGKIVSWAPQTRVLRHKAVGAHVTHCGWNSTVESIFAQVPMVCRPFPFADQMVNKGLVERVWGIGKGVEGGVFSDGEAARVIKTVLMGEEGRKMRDNIKELKRLIENDANGSSAAADFLRLMDIIRA